ncbi:putative 1,3-beta-glucan synthase [Helianthus anomalus]
MHRRAAKVNFVEIRSYWHVFRSFDRMWSFFILCLHAMIIVAWNGDGNLTSIFESDVFKKVLSVFITASILKLGQVVLDVVLNWKARQCMPFYVKLRYLLKVVSAAAWVREKKHNDQRQKGSGEVAWDGSSGGVKVSSF